MTCTLTESDPPIGSDSTIIPQNVVPPRARLSTSLFFEFFQCFVSLSPFDGGLSPDIPIFYSTFVWRLPKSFE